MKKRGPAPIEAPLPLQARIAHDLMNRLERYVTARKEAKRRGEKADDASKSAAVSAALVEYLKKRGA